MKKRICSVFLVNLLLLSSCHSFSKVENIFPFVNELSIDEINAVEIYHYNMSFIFSGGSYTKYIYEDQDSVEICFNQIKSPIMVINDLNVTSNIQYAYNFITDDKEYKIVFGDVFEHNGIKYQYKTVPYYYDKDKLVSTMIGSDEITEKYKISNLDVNDKTVNSNYLELYFYNLHKYFFVDINNYNSYSSVAALLSYYDNYLDDRIIDDFYDIPQISPSLVLEERGGSPSVKWHPYGIKYSELHTKEYYENTFFGYLYNLSNKNKIYNLTYKERFNLLNKYLKTRNIDNFKIMKENKNVREFTVEQVKKGIPVLVELQNDDGISMCSIAYKYDQNNDKLYYWTTKYNYIDLESAKFTNYVNAISLQFNFEHSCSNNYRVYNEDGVYSNHCYCYFVKGE